MSVNSPPPNVNCEYLYKLIMVHEGEISGLKVQLKSRETEISELRTLMLEKLASVTEQLQEIKESAATTRPASVETPVTDAGVLKQSIELLRGDIDEQLSLLRGQVGQKSDKTDHENIALSLDSLREDIEKKISGLKEELKNLNDGLSRIAVNGGEGGSENPDLEAINTEIRNVKEQAKKERRRAYLEGEQRDQYSRRETIRVTGVPYKTWEDTTHLMVRIAESLGVYISASDISVSHRSGRRVGVAPRPILVKFVRREVKAQILMNKKLAGNIKTDDDGNPVRIYLDENLTGMRARVCKKLRGERIPHHTKDGKLFVTPEEGETKVYDSPTDWENLDWSDDVKIELGIYPKD